MKNVIIAFASVVATTIISGCCYNCDTDTGYKVLTFEQAKKLYPQTLNAKDFGVIANDGKDDAQGLRNALAKAAEMAKDGNGVRIVLGKGKYDFLTYDGNIAVPIRNVKNVMIDGEGATIVHHKMSTNFWVSGSDNITLANMDFDTNELPIAGGKVIAIDKDKKTFDIELVAPYKVKECAPKAIIAFDPENDCMGLNLDTYQLDNKRKIEKLSDNSMRVPINHNMPKEGMIVLVRYEVYGPGVANLHSTDNTRIYNFNVFSHPGMGIHGCDTNNVLLDNINFRTRNKSIWMSATADATHFNHCKGRIDILNSTFEKMGDDATNVHQMYWLIKSFDSKTPNTFVTEFGNRRGGLRMPLEMLPKVGDVIEFGTAKNWLKLDYTATVKEVIPNIKEKNATIVLDKPLPDYAKAGMPFGNMTYNPDLKIKNCKVRGNRARGFLIKTENAIVENCEFDSTSLPAILFENDNNYWFEGCLTKNVKIKNCKFRNCDFWAPTRKAAILDAVAYDKSSPSEGLVNIETTVENCVFENQGENPIKLHQTERPILINNSFKTSK